MFWQMFGTCFNFVRNELLPLMVLLLLLRLPFHKIAIANCVIRAVKMYSVTVRINFVYLFVPLYKYIHINEQKFHFPQNGQMISLVHRKASL